MNPEDEAKRLFDSGLNCAESVLLAISHDKFPQSIEVVIPRNGDICGALAGGVMAISLALGRNSPEELRDSCYLAVDQFYSEFVREFGSCKCRELTGIDLKTAKGREEYMTKIHADLCSRIVVWATRAAAHRLPAK
jgi:C_GCAxxG_C_C family probable redox protein